MPSISLSDLQNAVDKNYGDFTIDLDDGSLLRFTAVLRLDEKKRAELSALQTSKVDTTDEWVEFVKTFFKIRAATPADFTKLDKLVKDPASWDQLFDLARQVEAPGEA